MRTTTRLTAGLASAALLAVPAVVLVSAHPAAADTERRGACGKGVYELSVDREDGGFEVGFDLDRVAPGSTWRIVLKQDGRTYFSGTRKADHEGDLDVERFRPDTAGKDVFRVTAKRVGGKAACSSVVTR